MTPNFALSLSFEGIRLLHRVAGGWALAGEVSLETADLTTEMHALRDAALALEPDGLRTKLLLPNDQIKYIAIDTTRTTDADIYEAVDRATPIPFDDLVIDFDRSGGRTQIAAVARQTLEEAEAFAKQYGFAPMMFVAVAEPLTFSCEVFFGATQFARDTLGADVEITRDDSLAVVRSSHTLPGFMTLPTPLAADPEIASEQPSFSFEDANRDVESPEVEKLEEDTPEPVEEEPPASVDDETTDDVEDALILDTDEAETVATAEDDTEATTSDPITELMFRRDRSNEAPVEDVETKLVAPEPEPEKTATQEPEPVSEDETVDPADEPVFTSRTRTRPVEITRARRVPDPVPAPDQSEPTEDTQPTEQVDDADPIAIFTRSAGAVPVVGDPIAASLSTSEPDAPDIPTPIKDTPQPTPLAAPLRSAPSRHPTPKSEDTTKNKGFLAPLLGVFSRSAPPPTSNADHALQGTKSKHAAIAVGGKPKHLGLILTASLLAVMVIAAMWANNRMENGIADLFSAPTLVPEIAENTAPTPVEPAPVDIVAVPAPSETPAPRQIAVTTAGTVLSPAEAARIYAATGVWQKAPRLADQADVGTLNGLLAFAALPAIEPIDKPANLDLGIALPDQAMLAPTNPAPANRPAQRDERGFILAAPNGTVLPTGVWIYGRKPAIIPPLRPTSDITPAAPTVPEAVDSIILDNEKALIDNAGPETDTAPEVDAAQIQDPIAPLPQTDDTSPDGVAVVAGRPSVSPPLRPGSAPPDASIEAGDLLSTDTALAAFRPSLRPDGLVPPPPQEPFADPALAGNRPSIRPEGLAPAVIEDIVVAVAPPEPEPEPEIAPVSNDISAIVASIAAAAPTSQIVNPTANAIATSPRPDARPRNFSQVVSSAQTLAARQQTPTAAPATPAAAVPTAPIATAPARGSGPTTATVAQAATLSNAIRLRDINLIGVYGRPGDRRALVRMGNGRFVKVEVGSSLDGGRVTAIGDSALNFVKRGQTYALQLPSG